MSGSIRIDKLLYFLRLAKTRAIAQSLIGGGRVRLDSIPVARSNTLVHTGQVLTIPLGDAVRVLRLLIVPVRRGPAPEAQACYELLLTLPAKQAIDGRTRAQ